MLKRVAETIESKLQILSWLLSQKEVISQSWHVEIEIISVKGTETSESTTQPVYNHSYDYPAHPNSIFLLYLI